MSETTFKPSDQETETGFLKIHWDHPDHPELNVAWCGAYVTETLAEGAMANCADCLKLEMGEG
jgi:hypothetical protein